MRADYVVSKGPAPLALHWRTLVMTMGCIVSETYIITSHIQRPAKTLVDVSC
jgi:hypothetical protein